MPLFVRTYVVLLLAFHVDGPWPSSNVIILYRNAMFRSPMECEMFHVRSHCSLTCVYVTLTYDYNRPPSCRREAVQIRRNSSNLRGCQQRNRQWHICRLHGGIQNLWQGGPGLHLCCWDEAHAQHLWYVGTSSSCFAGTRRIGSSQSSLRIGALGKITSGEPDLLFPWELPGKPFSQKTLRRTFYPLRFAVHLIEYFSSCL